MFPDQYPDKLVRQGESIEQALPCRFYPNSRSRGMKKVKDGNEVDVQYTISLPEETPNLAVGELITGYDERGSVIVWNDTIALFHHGHYHCVAYV